MSSEIHTFRERIASRLSDFEIWNEVLINILQLNASLEDKIDLISQAMPDLQKALAHLQYCYQNGLLSNTEYRTILNHVLLRKGLKSPQLAERLEKYELEKHQIR